MFFLLHLPLSFFEMLFDVRVSRSSPYLDLRRMMFVFVRARQNGSEAPNGDSQKKYMEIRSDFL